MKKKMYYKIDNGDVDQIVDADGMKEIIEGEAADFTELSAAASEASWTVTLVWMTDEEYESLPDAY